MAAIVRRAHTINVLIKETDDGLTLTGPVSISDQVIGPDKWWVYAENPNTTKVDLIPIGHLHSMYIDVNNEEVHLDLNELKEQMNPLWDKLEALSSETPTTTANLESGIQKQWHLPKELFIRYNSTRSFIIRPILFQNPGNDEQHQKLLISIHSLFVPPTTKKCRW